MQSANQSLQVMNHSRNRIDSDWGRGGGLIYLFLMSYTFRTWAIMTPNFSLLSMNFHLRLNSRLPWYSSLSRGNLQIHIIHRLQLTVKECCYFQESDFFFFFTFFQICFWFQFSHFSALNQSVFIFVESSQAPMFPWD